MKPINVLLAALVLGLVFAQDTGGTTGGEVTGGEIGGSLVGEGGMTGGDLEAAETITGGEANCRIEGGGSCVDALDFSGGEVDFDMAN